jgi:hypothetical protein
MAFDLGNIWSTKIASVLPQRRMTNEEWNALIAGKFPGLLPSDLVVPITPDTLTSLIRGVMPEPLTVDNLISTTADVSDLVRTKIGEILPADFAGPAFNAQAMMQTAINSIMSTISGSVQLPHNVASDLTTKVVNKVQQQAFAPDASGTGTSSADLYYEGATSWALWIENLVRSKRNEGKHFADVVNALPGMGIIGEGKMFETVDAARDFLITKAKVIPFAQGTNNVPQDMLAQIHKGEVIIPEAFNPERYSKATGNAALVEEIKALRAELAQLREEQKAGQNAIAANTRKTAQALTKFDTDGMPETRA